MPVASPPPGRARPAGHYVAITHLSHRHHTATDTALQCIPTMRTTTPPAPSDTHLPDSAHARARDIRTITLVGLAHGTSHFFHLLLPPLFPWFITEFGVSYSQLGGAISLFFIISGLGQMAAGFVVDRLGARPVLYAALASFVLAAVTAALAHSYAMLLVAAFFAGLGNAPFHPVDFSILNHRITPRRIGHAFSVHGICGNIGWASAPVFMTTVASASGSWRLACLAAAVLATVVLGIMVLNHTWLDDRTHTTTTTLHHPCPASPLLTATSPTPGATLAFLRLPAVWLCFAFFFWSTLGLTAIQSFSSPAMQALYGLPASVTALTVTGFMVCAAVGMVGGGFAASRVQRLQRVIAAFLLMAASLLALAGSGWLPGMAALLAVCAAGLGYGFAGPSRDMLIKTATPPGATGRVYGSVYSGLDLGFAMGAPIFGWLMDRHLPGAIFTGAAAALVLSVLAAATVGRGVQRARQQTLPTSAR